MSQRLVTFSNIRTSTRFKNNGTHRHHKCKWQHQPKTFNKTQNGNQWHGMTMEKSIVKVEKILKVEKYCSNILVLDHHVSAKNNYASKWKNLGTLNCFRLLQRENWLQTTTAIRISSTPSVSRLLLSRLREQTFINLIQNYRKSNLNFETNFGKLYMEIIIADAILTFF